jgi:hypothetical protein
MTRSLVIALAALTACAHEDTLGTNDDVRTQRDVVMDQEFTMAVGDMVRVEGTHVLVFFDAVTEDSRCPTGVQCPWEGDAAVLLELSADNAEFAPQPRTLHTALEPRAVEFLGVTIRLVEVAPYPNSAGPPIDPASYTVRLIATRS